MPSTVGRCSEIISKVDIHNHNKMEEVKDAEVVETTPEAVEEKVEEVVPEVPVEEPVA